MIGPSQNAYLLKILTARNASGFYFRGEALLLYRRLWKLLFNNLDLMSEIQSMIRGVINKATSKQESILKMKTSLLAIGLEEKTLLRDQLERRIRFYASVYEIQQVSSMLFVKAAEQIPILAPNLAIFHTFAADSL